jgi:ankyrin repeat protein
MMIERYVPEADSAMTSQAGNWEALIQAARRGDLDAIRTIVPMRIEIHDCDELGNPLLVAILGDLDHYPKAPRHEITRLLLELGADPNQRANEDDFSPLFQAVLSMDTEMIRILLDAGSDPNLGADGPEKLLDWALFDYRFEIWDIDQFPEPAPDWTNIDDRLEWLDSLAVRYGRRRPDYVRLLRERGARTYEELGGE